MNPRGALLGLAFFLALSAALILQVLLPAGPYVTGAWALAGVLLLLWGFFNRASLLRFLTRKSTRYGANLGFIIFLVLGILVFINILTKEHSWRKDLTHSGLNTLSEQSRKVLGDLKQDVHAYYFQSVQEKEKSEELFRRYKYLSPHFKYEFVDVDRFPTRAEAMGVKKKGTVVLNLGESDKKIRVESATEEQLTNGLIKLLRAADVSIYFTTGHGEHPLQGDTEPLGYAQLKSELTKQGYTVKELNLVAEGKIPADAAVVVVGGPKSAFFPKELEILSAWIRAGGHAAIAVDLDINENGLSKGSAQMATLLKEFGVSVKSQMLVDPTSKAANVEPQIILGFSGSKLHSITKDFAYSTQLANFLFPLTTYLTHEEKTPLTITPLAVTSATAWAEGDWQSIRSGRVTFDKGMADKLGPLEMAYALESPEGAEKKGKMLVFANGIFATNGLIDKAGNRDLILNSLAWAAGDDRFISIRAKDDSDAIKQYSNGLVNLILIVAVYLVPLLVLGTGIMVWWRRSKL